MATQKPAPGELADLVARMQHLQAEHTPLLDKIQGDAGMSRDVRSALVEHLNQEEDELRAKIALLSPATAERVTAPRTGLPQAREPRAALAPPRAASSGGARLTVGSLRREPPSLGPRGRAPGAPHTAALPAQKPAGSAARCSIGSLRRR